MYHSIIKETPFERSLFIFYNVFLVLAHSASAAAALFLIFISAATAIHIDNIDDRSNADEIVDNFFNHWPLTEKISYEIEVEEADKTPVESTNKNEYQRSPFNNTLHRNMS